MELVEEQPEPGLDHQSKSAPKRQRKYAYLALGILVLMAAAIAAWWFFVRQPDLNRFSDARTAALAILSDTQESTDDIEGPSELSGLAEEVEDLTSQLDDVEGSVSTINDTANHGLLSNVVEAGSDYLQELKRLASLPSADARPAEYVRIGELAEELNSSIAAVDGTNPLTISPTSVTAALADLAAYRKEVIKRRSRIRERNKERAEQLSEVRTFTGQFDGIIARYSGARGDLAAWIDGVDTYGASFNEAYRVLGQQIELRSQLRTELAALIAPDPFGTDKEAVLAVMDRAVAATEAAYDGILEYQFDFSYRYYSYDQTPGWRTFEAETSQISDDYSTALAAYEGQKTELVKRLSKRSPLPELPE